LTTPLTSAILAGVLGGMTGTFAIYVGAGLIHWAFSFVFVPLMFLIIALMAKIDSSEITRKVQEAEINLLKSVLFAKQNETRK